MFGRAIKLPFKLMGIPIHLDITFLLVVPLFTYLIGRAIKHRELDAILGVADESVRQGNWPYVLGFLAVLGLFLSVVIHELAHALAARWYGVKTRNITLWLLGGVAQFEQMPRQRGAEAVVAIVGPIISFLLGMLLLLVAGIVPAEWASGRLLLIYLGVLNIILAIFNLLPALPLDGGRVLRSLLALGMSHLRATAIAGSVSRVLAVLLGIWGILGFLTGAGNPFLILIAIFIYIAVNAETQQSLIEQLLHGIPVERIMTRDVVTIDPQATLQDLQEVMLRTKHLGFPVVDDGVLVGMVDLNDIEGKDPLLRVRDVMQPTFRTVPRHADVQEVFNEMGKEGFRRMIVVDELGRMAGILTKTDLLRLMQIRMASGGLRGDLMVG